MAVPIVYLPIYNILHTLNKLPDENAQDKHIVTHYHIIIYSIYRRVRVASNVHLSIRANEKMVVCRDRSSFACQAHIIFIWWMHTKRMGADEVRSIIIIIDYIIIIKWRDVVAVLFVQSICLIYRNKTNFKSVNSNYKFVIYLYVHNEWWEHRICSNITIQGVIVLLI